jgi:xylulose-5-phosphate/fructose-6-phosphate phosphoketolase
MSRYHLTIAALQRSTWLRSGAGGVIDQFEERLAAHQAYIKDHHEDLPDVLN